MSNGPECLGVSNGFGAGLDMIRFTRNPSASHYENTVISIVGTELSHLDQ